MLSRSLVALAVASSTLLAAIPAGAQETASSWVAATPAAGYTNPMVGTQATATYQYDETKNTADYDVQNRQILLKTNEDNKVSTLHNLSLMEANKAQADTYLQVPVAKYDADAQAKWEKAEQFNGSEAYKATVAASYWTRALYAKYDAEQRRAEKFHCDEVVALDPACQEKTLSDFAKVMDERSEAFGLTGFEGKAGEREFQVGSRWVIQDKSGGYQLFNLGSGAGGNDSYSRYVLVDFYTRPVGDELDPRQLTLSDVNQYEHGYISQFTSLNDWETLHNKWNAEKAPKYTQEDREVTPKWFRARLWQLNYEFTKLKGDADPVKAAYAEAWQNMLPALQTALTVSNRNQGDPDYDLFIVHKAEQAMILFANGYKRLYPAGLESYDFKRLEAAINDGKMGATYTPAQMDATNTYPSPEKTIDKALNEGSSDMGAGQWIALIAALFAVLGALAAAASQAFPPAAAPAPAPAPQP